MKCLAILIAFLVLLSPGLTAQTSSLLIEDTTWTEVRDTIAAGKTTAIYYAGSTEQNGPGVATTAVRLNLPGNSCGGDEQRLGAEGNHVYYIPDVYFKEIEVMREYMYDT